MTTELEKCRALAVDCADVRATFGEVAGRIIGYAYNASDRAESLAVMVIEADNPSDNMWALGAPNGGESDVLVLTSKRPVRGGFHASRFAIRVAGVAVTCATCDRALSHPERGTTCVHCAVKPQVGAQVEAALVAIAERGKAVRENAATEGGLPWGHNLRSCCSHCAAETDHTEPCPFCAAVTAKNLAIAASMQIDGVEAHVQSVTLDFGMTPGQMRDLRATLRHPMGPNIAHVGTVTETGRQARAKWIA